MRPPAKRVLAWIALALLLAGVALGARWWKATPSDRHFHAVAKELGVSSKVDVALMRRTLEFEADQRRMDETVWAPELEAQRHEEVFIQLWDALNAAADPWTVLRPFAFGSLSLGDFAQTITGSHGIQVRRSSDGGQRQLGPAEWQALTHHLAATGYRLAQSEWRHEQFEPATPGRPARSVFALTAHVLQKQNERRLIMRGQLNVTWAPPAGDSPQPFPAEINARNLEIAERTGPPLFRELAVETLQPEAGSFFIDPLILHDLDHDGRSEIILACRNVVYWNRPGGRFEAAPLCAQPARLPFTGLVADVTGDGAADFLVADKQGLLLFTGTPAGAFPEPARRVWTAPDRLRYVQTLTTGDIDGDGDLDVWLGQYKTFYFEGSLAENYYDANDGFPSFLLRNDGQGGFADTTAGSGLEPKRFRRNYAASFVDLDEDGDLDLLTSNDFAGPDVFFNDGHGRFEDGTGQALDQVRVFGMAHACADLNADGQVDLLAIGMDSAAARRLEHLGLGPKEPPAALLSMRPEMNYGNRFYLGQGGGRFRHGPLSDVLARTGWTWGVTAFDLDNDRDLDLYLGTGHETGRTVKDWEVHFWTHQIYLSHQRTNPAAAVYFRLAASQRFREGLSYGGYYLNKLELSEGGQGFQDVGWLAGVALQADSRNVASDDLDGDGRLDLIVTTFEIWPQPRQTLRWYRNECPQPGHWIGFRLEGGPRTPGPWGARVTLTSPSGTQQRWVITGESYRTQSASVAHFGLGTDTGVTRVDIHWPGGPDQRFEHPAIDTCHRVRPPAN